MCLKLHFRLLNSLHSYLHLCLYLQHSVFHLLQGYFHSHSYLNFHSVLLHHLFHHILYRLHLRLQSHNRSNLPGLQ